MGRDAGELALVQHLRVHLVREHPSAAVREQCGCARDLLRRERATRRVLGRVDDDELRALPEPRLEVAEVEREVTLLEQW